MRATLNVIAENGSRKALKWLVWRPFCLCKLDGQKLKILIRNRVHPIQHTRIMFKNVVPNFYPKMPLTCTFSRNGSRLFHVAFARLATLCHCSCRRDIGSLSTTDPGSTFTHSIHVHVRVLGYHSSSRHNKTNHQQ